MCITSSRNVPEENRRQDFSEYQNLTAKVCCVSKSNVSRVCREAKKGKEEGTEKVFLSLRKHTNIKKKKRQT
jgi:hypothetical protein